MRDDHRTPFAVGDEKETLLAFLDYLRAAVVRKTAGLPDDDVRRPGVGSGTSLLGIVKHLTRVEVAWFQWGFAGLDVRIPDDDLQPDDTRASVVADYEAAVAASNDVAADCTDLSARCRRAGVAPEPMTMRWILVHMVEETSRHAGHADILREQIDGTTGR